MVNRNVASTGTICRKNTNSVANRAICRTIRAARRNVNPSRNIAGAITKLAHSQSPKAQGQSTVSFCQSFICPLRGQLIGKRGFQDSTDLAVLPSCLLPDQRRLLLGDGKERDHSRVGEVAGLKNDRPTRAFRKSARQPRGGNVVVDRIA